MSAYEIGTKVVIDRTHEEGVISGVGQMDYGNSTGGVYVIDVGGVPENPVDVKLVFEEDLTLPDETQDIVLLFRVSAKVVAETEGIAKARTEDALMKAIHDLIDEDTQEDFQSLTAEVVKV